MAIDKDGNRIPKLTRNNIVQPKKPKVERHGGPASRVIIRANRNQGVTLNRDDTRELANYLIATKDAVLRLEERIRDAGIEL